MAEPVLLEITGAVATLTINRPEWMNAMDSAAHLALTEALDRLAEAAEVRVIVLTGAGDRAFSAGRDLKELAGQADGPGEAEIAERWTRIRRLTDRFDFQNRSSHGFAGWHLAEALSSRLPATSSSPPLTRASRCPSRVGG